MPHEIPLADFTAEVHRRGVSHRVSYAERGQTIPLPTGDAA